MKVQQRTTQEVRQHFAAVIDDAVYRNVTTVVTSYKHEIAVIQSITRWEEMTKIKPIDTAKGPVLELQREQAHPILGEIWRRMKKGQHVQVTRGLDADKFVISPYEWFTEVEPLYPAE